MPTAREKESLTVMCINMFVQENQSRKCLSLRFWLKIIQKEYEILPKSNRTATG